MAELTAAELAAEEWRPCPGHGRYQVSSLGRVRNVATGRVLRPQLSGSGYRKVHLGAGCQRLVHRLVCEAFHGAPELPSHHADHLDYDRTNNRADNLRWLPAHLNLGRQLRYGRHGWELEADDQPDEWVPLSDEQRAELDRQLADAGW